MIDWNAAAALTYASTSAMFDVTACTMKPMASPAGGRDVNARPVVDEGRAEFGFLAKLDLEPSQDSIPRHLTADPGSDGKMVAYDACIGALVDAWPYLPKRGDRVLIGTDLYQIVLDRRDGSQRMAFFLNKVK